MEEKPKKLVWKPEYEVGIRVIDESHRKFTELVNNFVDIADDTSCLQGQTDIFYSLIHYAEHYLIREEILFKDMGIQTLSQHKEKHTRFFEKIKYFQEKFVSGNPGICREMYAFLNEWFNEHILKYDQEIADALKEKGLP